MNQVSFVNLSFSFVCKRSGKERGLKYKLHAVPRHNLDANHAIMMLSGVSSRNLPQCNQIILMLNLPFRSESCSKTASRYFKSIFQS